MTHRVPDASVFARGWFQSQWVPEAAELLSQPAALFAPPVLEQEFTTLTWRLELRGSASETECSAVLRAFAAFDIAVAAPVDSVARALAVARRFKQPAIFDALYFVCAEALSAEMWTCDRRFVRSFGKSRPPWLYLIPEDIVAARVGAGT